VTLKKIDFGPTGVTVADNIRRLRTDRNLGHTELSRLLANHGRDIAPLGIRRIEAGTRRVDVDDLLALAEALGVSPITLLMPKVADRDDVVEVTGRKPDAAGMVWDWLRALLFRDFEDMQSLVASNPSWAIESTMQVSSLLRAQARKTAGIPLEQAHQLGVIPHGNG
jgi:transcriptional regulator with XRE-family HTH domain